MAIDIFSIPTMGSEAERISSFTGHETTPRKSRMKEDILDATCYLSHQHNIKPIKIIYTTTTISTS
jgi:hypothetical protein